MPDRTAKKKKTGIIAAAVVALLLLAALFLWRSRAGQALEEGHIGKASADWNFLDQGGVDVLVTAPAGATTVTYEVLEYQAGNWLPVEDGVYSISVGPERLVKEEYVSVTGRADGSFLLAFPEEADSSGVPYPINGARRETEDLCLLGAAEKGTAYIGISTFGESAAPGSNEPIPLLCVGYTDDSDRSEHVGDREDFFQKGPPADGLSEYEGYRVLTITFS